MPYYHGDPTEALQLARRSQDLAGRTPCAAATMAPVLEARALGQLARRGRTDVTEPARRALARGTESFAQLPVDHTRDTAFGYTERQLIFHEGNTRASLGDQQQADELLQRALTRYPESELLDRTLIRFDHAACRVRTGEIEEALRIGRGALLDLPSGHRTDIVVGRARELDEVASRHNGLPAAREFREVLALAPADGRD